MQGRGAWISGGVLRGAGRQANASRRANAFAVGVVGLSVVLTVVYDVALVSFR